MTNSIRGWLYNDCEKGDAMYYELYVDSLFLVNFVMNLYLLLLVNQSTFRTATRIRMVLGATIGAVFYLIPFVWNGPVWIKLGSGLIIGTLGMLFAAFRIRSIRSFFRIAEYFFLWAMLMGGVLLFLIKRIPYLQKSMTGIAGLLGLGTIAFLVFTYFYEQHRDKEAICHVTLIGEDSRIKVSALIDSGNSLVEPISGKPVSIIEKQVFVHLWKEEPTYYRAIPFHSIGKSRGILKGYLLPEMWVEINGIIKICRDVYVAVSEEGITGTDDGGAGVKLILNPALLEGERKCQGHLKQFMKDNKA